MKETHWALRICLLYVTNWCNNFTAPSISRDPLPFSLSVTQKSLRLLQPQAMLYISVSRKMFNDSHISPFHMTQRKIQKCMTRSQQTPHQLCLGDWGRSKNGREGCLLNWAKLLVDDAELEIRGRRCNLPLSHSHCRSYYLFSYSLVVLFH